MAAAASVSQDDGGALKQTADVSAAAVTPLIAALQTRLLSTVQPLSQRKKEA